MASVVPSRQLLLDLLHHPLLLTTPALLRRRVPRRRRPLAIMMKHSLSLIAPPMLLRLSTGPSGSPGRVSHAVRIGVAQFAGPAERVHELARLRDHVPVFVGLPNRVAVFVGSGLHAVRILVMCHFLFPFSESEN